LGDRGRFDAIVVGFGAMGSSAAYNLAKRGMKVLALEKFHLNHENGSSHGKSRIIRLAYYEDPRYVPLLRRAFESWRELEKESGRKLMTTTGGLMVGRPDGELVTGVLKSAKEHSIPHRVLSASEVGQSYPAFTLDDPMCAVHEESAGVLFPEECVRAYADLAQAEGAEVRFSEPATGWKSTEEGVEVTTKGGRYAADRVVVCAGPWNASLLREVVPLSCERQAVFWFPSEGRSVFSPGEMPVFIFEESPGTFYYGIPEFGDGVKVARTHGGEACDPDSVRREVTKDDVDPVVGFVSRRLKKLGRSPLASTTCIYTNTPDLNFCVGTHPADQRVVFVSACSGHGFKFASVMGEVAADLCLEGRSRLDVSFLDPVRFESTR
jgi:sarcosine oxidase